MTKRHVEQNIIKTHPLHLFRIIQDVDRYQDFLPLCRYSKIIRRSTDGRSFDGKLIVGSPPLFSEEYTSRVTVVPETLTILQTLLFMQMTLKQEDLERVVLEPLEIMRISIFFQMDLKFITEVLEKQVLLEQHISTWHLQKSHQLFLQKSSIILQRKSDIL